MDEQASVACATPSYHNRLRPTLDFSTKQPTTTFFVAYSLPQPPTPSPNTLFRPTLDCSAILPQPTAPFFVLHWPSYGSVPSHIVEKSSVGRRTTFFVLPLHWIGQPSYLIHPTTAYTGVFIYPTPSYHYLCRPTLECSASLLYATPSYHNLRTSYHVLHWRVFLHPTPSYRNLLRPTLECSAILWYRTLADILSQVTLACSAILP